MKQTSNKDMLNAIRNQASAEYQERIAPVMEDIEVASVLTKLEQYPSIRNEFISTLINKVVRTDFFSRMYENPLKLLKKGMLSYGSSIEELFVLSAEAKGFYSTEFDSTTTPATLTGEEDVVKTKTPDIKALYITKNFAHYFKTSISDAQLKSAFTSQNGLSELVNQIVGSLTNGAEQREYKDMIALIKAAAANKLLRTQEGGQTTGLIEDKVTSAPNIPINYANNDQVIKNDIPKNKTIGVSQVMYKYDIDKHKDAGAGPNNAPNRGQKISMSIRTLAGRMKFMSRKYNMAGVNTFCNPEDLVFLTTPEIVAELDVMVLAQAFNVSSADVSTRIILVDELPTEWAKGRAVTGIDDPSHPEIGYYYKDNTLSNPMTGIKACLGILMDKNFIQAHDTVNEARQFENGRTLTTNMYLHRQGILANCYFSNSVAIFPHDAFKNDGTYDDTQASVTPMNKV